MIGSAVARRIALAAQGFGNRAPAKPTVTHFRRALRHMQILQIDSVNVLCRSHYLPMLARVGPYDRDRLDEWLWRSGENMEFLAHEASLTSATLRPWLAHRFSDERWRAATQLKAEHPGYVESVLAEVAERGPLSVSDLSVPGGRSGPWWGSPRGKIALVSLHAGGQLAIADRPEDFRTYFDLPERVFSADVLDQPAVEPEQARRELLLCAAAALGVATAADIADYYRIRMPLARPLLADLVASGELTEVEVEGWGEPGLLHPDARRPRRIKAAALLSPFDPVVWFRPRAQRLFGFRYRIEIYVPRAKRVHGYYVLPFLLDDQLVGRLDLKADRKAADGAGILQVQAAFAESDADHDEVAVAMAPCLAELARFLGLADVAATPHGDLAPTLNRYV